MTESSTNVALATVLTEFEIAPSLRTLRDRIERLSLSADTKALLLDVAAITLNVGGRILALGRKVLAVIFDLVAKFQNVGFGVIIALVLSAVLASIPLLGPAIAALLTPIMLAFGIARGAILDFNNAAVLSEINALKQKMTILSSNAAL